MVKSTQAALALHALVAWLAIDPGHAAQPQAAIPKKIVLPIQITACSQYLEIADLQRKNQERKQQILAQLVLERDVEVSIQRARAAVLQTEGPEAIGSLPDGAASSINSVEIKMISAELATGNKVVGLFEDAYRRCIAAPQALVVPAPPAAAKATVPARTKRTVPAKRASQQHEPATPPGTGHDPGASAVVGGVIGGALGGIR